MSPYFAWNSYRTGSVLPMIDPGFPSDRVKDAVLTQIVGGNGQLQLVGGRGGWRWHLGAGPAIYRVVVQNHRKVLKDPVSKDLHQGTYLGATAEYGMEHFLHSLTNSSLEWTVAYQTAFAKRRRALPLGIQRRTGRGRTSVRRALLLRFQGAAKARRDSRPGDAEPTEAAAPRCGFGLFGEVCP